MNSEKLLITSPVGPKITPTTEASSTPQLATPNSPTPGAGATSSMAFAGDVAHASRLRRSISWRRKRMSSAFSVVASSWTISMPAR